MSDSSRPHGLQPTRLLRPWDFPGKSTGVGCHCLLRIHSLKLNKYLQSRCWVRNRHQYAIPLLVRVTMLPVSEKGMWKQRFKKRWSRNQKPGVQVPGHHFQPAYAALSEGLRICRRKENLQIPGCRPSRLQKTRLLRPDQVQCVRTVKCSLHSKTQD